MTTTLPRCFQPPRLPQRPPVTIVAVKTARQNYGTWHPHHAYVINTHRGQLVEIISGDDTTEQRVFARYPWFSSYMTAAFNLSVQYWLALSVWVAPKEYDRIVNLEPYATDMPKVLRMADRCAEFSEFREAINAIRRSGTVEHPYSDMPATVYHRTKDLRRRLDQAEAAGIIVRMDDSDWREEVKQISGQYRATKLTPYV